MKLTRRSLGAKTILGVTMDELMQKGVRRRCFEDRPLTLGSILQISS